ncbi:MAG: hypothetical protein RJA99_2388 [Pseudomonadota bacterium]|jgi:hypothetical protein
MTPTRSDYAATLLRLVLGAVLLGARRTAGVRAAGAAA